MPRKSEWAARVALVALHEARNLGSFFGYNVRIMLELGDCLLTEELGIAATS
jgi:hypothetical protein